MKALEKIDWKDLKIGEVFAWRFTVDNSASIEIKTTKSESFILSAENLGRVYVGETNYWYDNINVKTFRLSKADQQKFIVWGKEVSK